MNKRRVIVTIEIESDIPATVLKSYFAGLHRWKFRRRARIIQVQTNVMKKAKP